MFYSWGKVVRYPKIESAIKPLLFANGISCSGIRAESQLVADDLLFVISRNTNADNHDDVPVEWEFHWDVHEEFKELDREPLLLMEVIKYTDTLLCTNTLEVNPNYRGIGIHSTVQDWAPQVLSRLSKNYILDVAILSEFALTSHFIKKNRYALHEIQNIPSKMCAIQEYFFVPGHVSMGVNPVYNDELVVRSEFVGMDLNNRLAYYHLLAKFAESVMVTLDKFYKDSSLVSDSEREFLFFVIENSGFNPLGINQILSHSTSRLSDEFSFLPFRLFKMYFAKNYYQISQKLGMVTS